MRKHKIYFKFIKTIKTYNLFQENDFVLVAFSGGPDSSALLHLLLEFSKEFPLKIELGHFNHKLRGEESDKDEEFVKREAERLGIPIHIGSDDVRSYAKSRKINLEEAGSILRYKFLKSKAKEIGATKIALGHTMNDQAETFLMRVLRGSGLKGLSSIFPVKDEIFVRPLIEIKKDEIEDYLKMKGIPSRIDSSNLSLKLLRNIIRLELIPYLEERFGKKLVEHLSKSAHLIREEDEINRIFEEEKIKDIVFFDDKLKMNVKALRCLPLPLQRRIVRRFIEEAKGNLRRIGFYHIELVRNLEKEREAHLPGKMILRREGEWVFKKEKRKEKRDYSFEWDLSSPLEIPHSGHILMAKSLKVEEKSTLDFDDSKRAYLDFDKVKLPLIVRNRREGDQYSPLGSPGRKKINEVFRQKRILPAERDFLPLIISKNEIVWSPGVPVSENFKVDEKTEKILLIETKIKNS
ncbi:MAG: tRNA lysidine(34) synthetase TilS [Candidatus Aminicenantia bacterium]